MTNRIDQVSVTPTVDRQTPRNEFGEVLRRSVRSAANTSGALIGALPGAAIVSAAVSSVLNFATQGQTSVRAASTAVSSVGTFGSGGTPGSLSPVEVGTTSEGPEVNDMLRSMRAEADRSIAMQVQMQTESREYNTLSNVLKVRHDSAKAAINNIR